MKTYYLVALAALASATAMAQAPAGTTMRTPQEANAATSGGVPAANAQGKTDAKQGTSMGASGTTMGHGPSAMDFKAMDANGDGMISQEEYMAYHTRTWTKMKMTRNGMISITDMQAQMTGGPN